MAEKTPSVLVESGLNALAGFGHESTTYVAEPFIVDGRVVFPNDLAPEQRALFENFTPVSLRPYETTADFVADERPPGNGVGTLNFIGFFQPPETLMGMSHRTRNVFRRMQIVAPDLVEELQVRLANASSVAELDSYTQDRLCSAYNIMTKLVDVNDHAEDERWNVFHHMEMTDEGIHFEYDPDYLKH